MNQSGRMEKVREALAFEAFTVMDEEQWIVDAALAEVEEWEARARDDDTALRLCHQNIEELEAELTRVREGR